MLRYGSVCSGIEAATTAWHTLGWEPAWFAEIDRDASAVLSHRYPGVHNFGDFTAIEASAGPIDVLVGGTPCQSFSVAGLRKGLDDDRGNLALEFLRLAGRLRPAWVVWENVPGVLSSLTHDAPDPRPPDIDLDGDDGPGDGEEVVVVDEYESDETHAFACFLAGLQELGYGVSYRVLDAQHFGVPQRRRRVFVVGHLGDWRRAAAVLFERDCLSGNPPPGREAGEGVAGGASEGFTPSQFGGYRPGAVPLRAEGGDVGHGSEVLIAHTLRADGFDASKDGTGRGTPLVAVPYIINAAESCATQSHARKAETARCIDSTGSFANAQGGTVVGTTSAVRRLTPRECERLQGFPDDWTLVPYRGKPASDGPRYKAIGNSMAVPVMRWIGERIQAVHQIKPASCL